ncbi:MAG: hypothetical protein ACOYBL_03845 [Lachnospiraceae bacterium]
MNKLLSAGQKWRKSRYFICRMVGSIILWILRCYGKWVEYSVRNEVLPDSWEMGDAQRLREKIWQAYQKGQ